MEEIELAVQWAHLHPCADGETPAAWAHADGLFDEGHASLAGPGTPEVAEFAPATLAGALGISLDAGRQLIADALELTYRLPRLWDHARAGRVPVWRARQISRETHDLSLEAVGFADRLISATPTKINQVDATRLVNEARLYFDPDRAAADEEAALARRGVWLRHSGAPATTEVFMTLDTPDALLFDQTVSRVAGDLRQLGDTDPLDTRRARAVGILADPQYALDLMSGHEGAAPTPGRSGFGAANLYLHLTPQDLTGLTDSSAEGVGAVSIERLGAATTRLLTDWLTRHTGTDTGTGGRVIVRPVLDPTDPRAVDAHDPPGWMRETATLRDATCVFPGCTRDSRACDLDHINPYQPLDDGGPPGQTSLANLAPLCRTHHRVKTHSQWTYRRNRDGTYTWTAPTGHQLQVRPPDRRPPPRPAAMTTPLTAIPAIPAIPAPRRRT